jgi:hypothetical protein
MASFLELEVTWQFLDNNPESYFVFGDNLQKRGKGGAAKLRDHPQAIGFITKKFPDNLDGSFYRPEEYVLIFFEELGKLKKNIDDNSSKTFYISQLGGGLANKYYIWEKLIKHNLLRTFKSYSNVVFCWLP